MSKKKKSPPKPEELGQTVVVNREHFQNIHSAARSIYANMLLVSNPSLGMQMAMVKLDEAIAHGHEVLGTDRGFADQYTRMAGSVTQNQMKNLQAFLSREGIDADNIRQFPTNRS